MEKLIWVQICSVLSLGIQEEVRVSCKQIIKVDYCVKPYTFHWLLKPGIEVMLFGDNHHLLKVCNLHKDFILELMPVIDIDNRMCEHVKSLKMVITNY